MSMSASVYCKEVRKQCVGGGGGRNPNSGHYTADVRQADGHWLRFDDDTVLSCNLKDVLHDKAYLLFYRLIT